MTRTDGGDAVGGGRLAPQPAKLLALLVERRGEVVSHEEIRHALWPDVEVDFERGLHFCVRQVRDALGDSADAPRFVENLPRRGYRLRAEERPSIGGTARGGRWRAALLPIALILGLAVGLFVLGGRGPTGGRQAPIRVAILPFRPPPELAEAGTHASIAEEILIALDDRLGDRVALIGPTTTEVWTGGEGGLRELMRQIEPDYLVHGRYLTDAEAPRLLGELIRSPDGAHVWVEVFDPIPGAEEIASRVVAGASSYLEGLEE